MRRIKKSASTNAVLEYERVGQRRGEPPPPFLHDKFSRKRDEFGSLFFNMDFETNFGLANPT